MQVKKGKVKHCDMQEGYAMEQPKGTAAAVELSQAELRRQAVHTAEEKTKVTQSPWTNPEDLYWILNVYYCVTCTVGVWFCIDLIVTVPWFSPLEVKSYLIYF